jgi:hypothetical protein
MGLMALSICLAFGATQAFADQGTDINNILAALYPQVKNSKGVVTFASPVIGNAKGTQLQAAINVLAAPVLTNVTGNVAVSGSNNPDGTASYITYVLQHVAAANVKADAPLLLGGFFNGVSGQNAVITKDLGAVTAACVDYSVYPVGTLGQAAVDSAEAAVVTAAIKDAGTDISDILVKSLAKSDPAATAQATLFTSQITTATLTASGGATLQSLATALAASGDVTSGNVAQFLETAITKESTAPNRQGLIEGFTTGYTETQLATVATNVAAIGNTVSAFSIADKEDLFIGLSTSGGNTTQVIKDVTSGILTSVTGATPLLADTARATLTSGLITTAYAANAGTIAGAAAPTVAVSDLAAFTGTVLANAQVKAGTGSNGILGVTQSIADAFTVSDASLTSGNILAKESVAEAGFKASPANAGAIASAVTAQVLGSGAVSPTNKVTFATNFISAVDAKSGNAYASITDAVRSAAALNIAQTYNSVSGLAVAVSTQAVADAIVDDVGKPTGINAVVQPILSYFTGVSTTEAGQIAASVSNLPGAFSTTSYTVPYLGSQLILGAKTGSTPNAAVIDAITDGLLNASYTGSTIGGSVTFTPDTLLSGLAAQLDAAGSLAYLKEIGTHVSTENGYTGSQVISDILAANVGALVANSGTLAAVIAKVANGGNDAAKVAYAAANSTAVLGAAVPDTTRATIGKDVILDAGQSVAVSGSVAQLLTVADKATFAKTVVGLDPTNAPGIGLAIAQTVPSTDTAITTELSTITNDAIAGIPTASKSSGAYSAVAFNVLENYNGANSGSVSSPLGYAQVATITAAVNKANSSVTGLTAALISTLVPYEITANANSPDTAALIAQSFATVLPTSALAITNASISSSLYHLTPTQAATIGADVTVAAGTSVTTGLSGTIAGIVAAQAKQFVTGEGSDDVYTTVAGVYATKTGLPLADVAPIISTLVTSATTAAAGDLLTGGHGELDNDSPAIVEAFTSQTAVGTSLTTLKAAVNAAVLADPLSAADILGYVLNTLPSGAPTGIAATLQSAVYADLTTNTAAETLLETALETTPGTPLTLTQLEALLLNVNSKTKVATGVLANVLTDLSQYTLGSIDNDETPIVPL